MIVPVETEWQLLQAAAVHAFAWQASHRTFCSPAFVAAHTPARQAAYLRDGLEQGRRLFLLLEREAPVGIVSFFNDQIGDLYVLPDRQGQGYGTALLRFAMQLCRAPRLTVLSTNTRAIQLYSAHGFRPSGRRRQLSAGLWELEFVKDP